MTKRMLIDATQPEETRVVMLHGQRVEDFDFETASRQQLKGNIYLARVTRVEPSLQAAFIEYGGNRHGFLAFSGIHPDYYRIPMGDRQALLAEESARAAEYDDDDDDDRGRPMPANARRPASRSQDTGYADDDGPEDNQPDDDRSGDRESGDNQPNEAYPFEARPEADASAEDASGEAGAYGQTDGDAAADQGDDDGDAPADVAREAEPVETEAPEAPETVGGDVSEELPRRRKSQHRRYKIQEVVTRRQIMLVQVVKEERGNKGAALTTYLSLAGRYCVLMPNTARGGGVSRKITSVGDRKRLKSVVEGLDLPDGMAVIVRTAGSQRTKTEIKRDYEYLLRLWDQIREMTLKSSAPCLIYEEANLIKRSIRDLYTRDIDEVLVEGEDGYRVAKDFMKTLVPSHAKRVQPYRDGGVPLFHRFQVEGQLDAIHSPVVQLRSGGYIVMNQTEALVAIDVNSGRSTRERNIEETAFKTNIEAADEVARQLRLRDLAGLVVVDFIDMEESRNQHAVERRMKDAMRADRARIQLGRISHFGLMELSRQRLRTSVFEASTQLCPHCRGSGRIRSIESAALHVLRAIEEEGIRQRANLVTVHVSSAVGFYILNHKREALAAIEARYGFLVRIDPDEALVPPDHRIERMTPKPASERMKPVEAMPAPVVEDDDDIVEEEDEDEEAPAERPRGRRADPRGERAEESSEERGEKRGRRRRRRSDRGRRGGESDAPAPVPASEDAAEPEEIAAQPAAEAGEQVARPEADVSEDRAARGPPPRTRRGRRGRARRAGGGPGPEAGAEDAGAEDGGAEDGGAEDSGAEDGGAEDGGALVGADEVEGGDAIGSADEDAGETADIAAFAAPEVSYEALPAAETAMVEAEPVDAAAPEMTVAAGFDDEQPVSVEPTEAAPVAATAEPAQAEEPVAEEPAAEEPTAPLFDAAPDKEPDVEPVPEAVTGMSGDDVAAMSEPEAAEPASPSEQGDQPAPAAVPLAAEESVEKPSGPPRRGWWNRLVT